MTLEEIAEEYLDRLRLHNAPDIEEYAAKFPDIADEIRDTLPALAAMEQFGIELDNSKVDNTTWVAPKVEQVGDYRIVGELGRGGMGIVYEAEQQSLRRRVALKVLPRMASDENSLARFQREARAAARLHHTNIVPVFQVGQDGEHAYYAMQLIEGQGLDAVIRDLRSLPRRTTFPNETTGKSLGAIAESGLSSKSSSGSPSDLSQSDVLRGLTDSSSGTTGHSHRFYRSVCQIGLQSAEALSYAHDRGIVHRDIKPSNLLLDASGVVWVSDFGLAMTDEGQLTRTEDVLGTIRYMSPERFQHQCDERADIYALGMTLYELLVLEPAFGMVNRLNLIKSIMNDDPPPPRQFDSHIPRDLETIILKAIEKEPRDRYSSAAAMAGDLRRFLNDEPIEARRVRPLEKLGRWRRRNRGLAAALSALVIAVTLLIVVLAWTSFNQKDLLRLAEERGIALQDNLYLAQMNLAGQAVSRRYGIDSIREQLDEWKPARAGRDLRNWEWYYFYGLSHEAEFVSEPLGNNFCWACDHDPSGRFVVNTKNGWGIQVRDARTGQVVRQRKLGSARSVDWSPDGSKIAVGVFSDTCFVLDAETLETVQGFRLQGGGQGWAVCWHPNSKWLAEVREHQDPQERSKVRIIDFETKKLLWAVSHEGLSPRILSWHPGGTKLAASGSSQTAVWILGDGVPELEAVYEGTNATWSPDGSMLAVSRSGGVWDALTDAHLADSGGSIAWSPSSERIAIGCGDGLIRVHDIKAETIRPKRSLRGHTSEIWSVSWSPDDAYLVSCGLRDETVRIWKVDRSDPIQFIAGQGVQVRKGNGNGNTFVTSGWYSSEVTIKDEESKQIASRNFDAQINIFAPSPTGATFAVFTLQNKVLLWNWAEDSVREIGSDRDLAGLAWSNQGHLAANGRAGEIIVWNSRGELLREIKNASSQGSAIHWSPDGRYVVACGVESSMKLWEVSTGKKIWEILEMERFVNDVRFSHDGTRIATSHRNAIVIWDASTGQQLKKLTEVRENFASLDWSPDDSRIVTGSQVSVALWDPESGRFILRLDAPNRLSSVRWTKDGMRVAASGETTVVYDASRGYALNPTLPPVSDPAKSGFPEERSAESSPR